MQVSEDELNRTIGQQSSRIHCSPQLWSIAWNL